ncbi:MAG TPA: SDR family oxidoreductase, partial [Trebonia sp.]
PAGAEPLAVDGLYAHLTGLGYDYGPAFQGIRAAWRDGDKIYTEVALPDEHAGAAQEFGLHPALFDAALQSGAILLTGGGGSRAVMPFSWSGAQLERHGTSRLRVRIEAIGEFAVRLDAVDDGGATAVSVRSIVVRPVDQNQLSSAQQRPGSGSLFTVQWAEITGAGATDLARIALLGDGFGGAGERYADLGALERALAGGAAVPDVVVVPIASTAAADDAEAADHAEAGEAARAAKAARAAAELTLRLLQRWLASESLAGTRLVVVTGGGIAVGGEAPDVAVAPVWGLVRSAQSEHPGRFVLVDVDDGDPDWGLLAASGEPQLAVRAGRMLAPSLARAGELASREPRPLDPDGTVLITGGTGGLGALVARHLVATRGVRRLLLVSRRGPAAEGAGKLADELEALGAQVRVAACDVADRAQVAELIGSLRHPLTAVVHAAGVLDDGLLESLTAEQVERVMRPKMDAALYLDELTAGMNLSAFVLFSSVAALIGSPGQGDYAAANAGLDALAARRRAAGRPATSLAWGLWADATGMTSRLEEAQLARLARMGMEPLSAAASLALFDQALRLDAAVVDQALVVPVRLDPGALSAQARAGLLPSLLSGL